jgi:hypothetical protein
MRHAPQSTGKHPLGSVPDVVHGRWDIPIRDAGDLRDWLIACADAAAAGETASQFFDRLR